MHSFVIFEQKFEQHWSECRHWKWDFMQMYVFFFFNRDQWWKFLALTEKPLSRQMLSLWSISLVDSSGWFVSTGDDVDGIGVGCVWYVFDVVASSLSPNLLTNSSMLFIVAGGRASKLWSWRSTHLYENDRQLFEQQSLWAVHCK